MVWYVAKSIQTYFIQLIDDAAFSILPSTFFSSSRRNQVALPLSFLYIDHLISIKFDVGSPDTQGMRNRPATLSFH
jgi:hypothetical protein